MATVLTTAQQLADEVERIGRGLVDISDALRQKEKFWKALQAQGVAPTTIKTRMDNIFEGYDAMLRRYGQELGNESSAPLLPIKFATQWKSGSPPGIGYLLTGGSNSKVFLTSTNASQDGVCRYITYNDVAPNYDLFSGVKANDVILVENCGADANNGRYTIKYDVAAKGTVGTASTVSTYGPNSGGDTFWEGDFRADPGSWTVGTDWSLASGAAVYSDGAGTTARTLTHALASMTSGAAYAIQFDLTIGGSSPVGTLTCTIGGDTYWKITTSATAAVTTYSFISNAPSATPTLTFTAQRTSGTFTITVDNVYVYGAPALVTNETFSEEESDDTTTITLEQTAA